MRYRNTVTGAVLETKSTIISGNWQEENPANATADEKASDGIQAAKKKAVKKKNE